MRRLALLAAGCALAIGTSTLAAPAALDMAVGARKIVKSQPVSSCNAAAKNALNSVLQDASEVGSGDTGEWRANGAPDSAGHSAAAAAVHCYPLDDGYVVTFTCAVQTPDSTDSASALCTKLATAFGGGP